MRLSAFIISQESLSSSWHVIQAIRYDKPFLGLEYPNRVPANAIARPSASLKGQFAPKKRMAFSRFWLI
jgi:hypothetical protein